MADILIDAQTTPSTPAAGKGVIFVDSTTKKITLIDDAGGMQGVLSRAAGLGSTSGYASDTYITTSGILIPSYGMKAGMMFRWTFAVGKTAAGVAAAVIIVRIGSAQSTADTARLTLTSTVIQTAAAADGLVTVLVGVRNIGASGVIAGGFGVAGPVGLGGGATGASSTFDNSALAGQYVGLSLNAGASAVWSITNIQGELIGA